MLESYVVDVNMVGEEAERHMHRRQLCISSMAALLVILQYSQTSSCQMEMKLRLSPRLLYHFWMFGCLVYTRRQNPFYCMCCKVATRCTKQSFSQLLFRRWTHLALRSEVR